MILPLFLSLTLLAQAAPPVNEILQPQQVRPLPGQLDKIPVFNSNSPELILNEGILLSTFPKTNKKQPEAHLNFPFQGKFDIFAHHIAKPPQENDLRTLYLGILAYNPGIKPVTINILEAASYLSQPDAPFIPLDAVLDNSAGNIFAGPGSRVMNDILRGKRQPEFVKKIIIPPQSSRLLLNAPIPVKNLEPPLNGRSTLMRLESDGAVYIASLAKYATLQPNRIEIAPTLTEWEQLLQQGMLVTPRDRTPTPPNTNSEQIIYGRVAGVALGSRWNANIVDPNSSSLTIPKSGETFSYPISSLPRGQLGTNQIQSAPLVVRYPDTAYQAHGNYGIEYNLILPLYNPTSQPQKVILTIQTPIKEEKLSQPGLRFFDPPAPQVFFRGTVRLSFGDDQGKSQIRYIHLVQKRGQQGESLVQLILKPQETRSVKVDFLYPPDASPPQVLTVKTLPLK
ncbi:conserved exported hypothetical protein [Planktothrix rubescens CCAP 1459/22]|uniref:DUF3370 domain-containing protein n=1 Tax=Planktothrix rubescens CCAP 1459/22 TaxID=329571 RepID=A0A6J7ZGA5_PLARU|nr:conserved exported hypothetical protein [Planktothrix rubescens NIVA-CYA 18]CAD5924677.1 hypothetical protein NO108_01271 [Planktothrix rubescens]CAD5942441.1 hypothetical protein PCC7821_01993 [Planktothrix rubescens NIVA-CYA 18]